MEEKAKCKNCTDEMIEEMKQILVDYALKYDLCFSFEVMRKHAEVLIKAGYRNCKDKVVLMMEEVDEFRKDSAEVKFLKNKIIEQARKETAKEIFYKLKETLIINNEENTEFFDYNYTLETIDELAKQFGVEVEE